MMEYLSWNCNGKWPPSTDKEIKALADNVDHAMDNKRPFRTAVVVFPRDPRSPKLDEVCLLETESICSFPRREPPDRTRWAESVIALMDLVSLFSRRAFPAAPLRPKEAAYRLGETEDGRGKGMFALRELRMGSLLLAERPSVVLPNKEMVYSVKVEGLDEGRVVAVGTERMLECVLERMEEEDKEAYLKLEGKECEVDCPLYGRMLTNGMVVVLREKTSEHHGDPMSYCAVFKDISRINHSCGPNATAFFDVQSFSMQLRAVRDIEPGEEVCISYTDIRKLAVERREALLKFQKFECRCGPCREPTTSDRLRVEIGSFPKKLAKLYRQFAKFSYKQTAQPLIEVFEKAIQLIQMAQLEALEIYCICLMYLVDMYQALGNMQKAVRYGTLAGQWRLAVDNDRNTLLLLREEEYHRSSALWRIAYTKKRRIRHTN